MMDYIYNLAFFTDFLSITSIIITFFELYIFIIVFYSLMIINNKFNYKIITHVPRET